MDKQKEIKMKIAKALKLKNRLAGEITRLKGIVMSNNSRIASNAEDYDVKNIFEVDLQKRIQELVLVKTVIACTNSSANYFFKNEDYKTSPFWAIFMIAELKGLIQTLRSTNTRHGSVGSEYDPDVKQIEYVAAYEPRDIDGFIATYTAQIDDLQELLDTHNAIFSCDLLDDISI